MTIPEREQVSERDPVIDPDVIASLKELGGEEEPGLFVEVVELFLLDATQHVESLQRALACGDAAALERTAHSLKSSSANVGALHFSRLCFEIERRGRSAQLAGLDELVGRAVLQYSAVRTALEAVKH